MFKVWYSTESFADFIIDHTMLKDYELEKNKMYESDANNPKNFHSLPDHIKNILYLDAPDLIVEYNSEPVFTIEVTTEAGTGHNAFQRFARIAASVENNVPAFYIYPEAAIITRENTIRWDSINPLVFKALDDVMSIYSVPALLYYFPTDFRNCNNPAESTYYSTKGLMFDNNIEYAGCPNHLDQNMKKMFLSFDEILKSILLLGVKNGTQNLLSNIVIREQRDYMLKEYYSKDGSLNSSPLTSTIEIDTKYLLDYLKKYENGDYRIGRLLRNREKTIIYNVDAKFRGDPYPGCLAAIDYLKCREGKTFEDRRNNLVMVWGKAEIVDNELVVTSSRDCSINDFVNAVKSSSSKNLLNKNYNQLDFSEIPRYYMQVRHGSTYSKVKHIRVYSYFADAILFEDGSVWRDG